MVAACRWGCLVRQTHVKKHVWTCSNLRLYEPQTKWIVPSQVAKEAVRVRSKDLEQRINKNFCVKIAKSASETLAILRVAYGE
jgi:hypothetical protein